MSALARYFLMLGKDVAGYDRVRTALTDQLMKEGARIHFQENPEMLKKDYDKREETLVIFTPAVPSSHPELVFFRQNGFKVLKRSEVLGEITKNQKCIAVAGTHGKTTVSAMIAHLLKTAGIPCNAFLGGISKNFETNAVISKNSEWIVAEADEFDRSFLKLFPDRAVVTSCDPDHLDIYGDTAVMQSAFREFINQVKKNASILIRKDIEILASGKKDAEVFTYSLDPGADFYVTGKELAGGEYYFDLHTPGETISGLKTILPGYINVENAVAAAATGYLLDINTNTIAKALGTYQGVKRRFDIHINREEVVYIDDYAHHPKEIESFVRSVRELYPGRKITAVFQPHLYTRTRDFADDFAKSLSLLDELIMLDIYPARELPIPGITSEMILKKVSSGHKILCSKENLMMELKKRHPDILLTMGAGDIDQFVEPIIKMLS